MKKLTIEAPAQLLLFMASQSHEVISTLREGGAQQDSTLQSEILALDAEIIRRAKIALNTEKVQASTPRHVDTVGVGTCLLWEKICENEDGTSDEFAWSLIVSEIIYDLDEGVANNDLKIVRIEPQEGMQEFWLLLRGRRGWHLYAGCDTFEQALQWLPSSATDPSEIHSYFKKHLNILAGSDATLEDKKTLARKLLSGPLFDQLKKSTLNLQGDLIFEAQRLRLRN